MPAHRDTEHRFVTVADGRRLAVSELGDPNGYPVVWCHGGLSSRIDIELARDGIERVGMRLITVDRPGIGESARRKGRKVADWPADIAAVADDLGIERFAVAGWSAGGPYALACAARLPERVAAVATIGGMAPIRSRHDRRQLGLAVDRMLIPLSRWAPGIAAAMLSFAQHSRPDRLKARTLKTLPEPDAAILSPLPPQAAVGYSLMALRHGTHGTVDDYRAFGGSWDFDLADVHTAVRCWQGEADTLLPMEHAERLAGALPNGALHRVPAAGHFLFVTHADRVFGSLLADARA